MNFDVINHPLNNIYDKLRHHVDIWILITNDFDLFVSTLIASNYHITQHVL